MLFSIVAAMAVQHSPCRSKEVSTPYIVVTERTRVIVVSSDGRQVLEMGPVVWGPNWSYTGLPGAFAREGDGVRARVAQKLVGTGVPFELEVSLRPDGSRGLRFRVTFRVEADTDLTAAVWAIRAGETLHGPGRATVTSTDGSRNVDLPLGRGVLDRALRTLAMTDESGRTLEITLDSPTETHMDNEARVLIASQKARGGEARSVSGILRLPGEASFHLTPEDVPPPPRAAEWFPWTGTGHGDGCVFDLSDWLDRPAGRQGRIVAQGDRLVYGGKPIKLWGLNLCYEACAPPREVADRRAAFYARYGINAVRLHKYADGPGWAGICADSAVRFDPAKLDRLDYFVAQLKARGIFIKLSANFGSLPIGPADHPRIPFVQEIPPRRGHAGWRVAGQGMLWFSSELQDLQVEQLTRLLEHTNPYTGLRYADDPAIAFVELVNENSLFFYTTLKAMQQSPTIRRRAGEAFFHWLQRKYGSEEKLIAAWGAEQIGTFAHEGLTDEGWSRGVIYPIGNPWFFDPDQLNGSQQARRARLLDTMAFFHDHQLAVYRRMVEAIRATGYQGEIIGSNWQAGRAVSHFLNLHTDAQVGTVDRHNYFAGTGSMLAQPGSGILSTGLQQVGDRPFMISEWIHEFPSEFVHEGAAILAAFGLGLNGWDASFAFQNGDGGTFRTELRERWDVVVPQMIGLFPAVARQIHRGDVRESTLVLARNVHVESLKQGLLGFDDRVTMRSDVKEFSSDVLPAWALAVARCVVRFTAEPQPTEKVDLQSYADAGGVRSATGELRWRPGAHARDGYFTIDTPATQAAIGFLPETPLQFTDLTLTCRAPYAAVYITAMSPAGTVAADRRLLVVALGRVRNRDMRMVAGHLLARGGPPLMLEPVELTLEFPRRAGGVVHVLDHDGRRTGRSLELTRGRVTLDSASTRTIYYELEFP